MERKEEKIIPPIPHYGHDERGYFTLIGQGDIVRPVDVVDGKLVTLDAELVIQRIKNRGSYRSSGVKQQ